MPVVAWIARACALVLLVLAVCESTSAESGAAPECLPSRGDVMIGDALLHVPKAVEAPLALVVAFHGAGGTGTGFAAESGLSRYADHHGFAVLYPQAGSS